MGTTSNHHAPYDLGYTRATMGTTKRRETARWSQTQKSTLSSDCGLQPAHMKLELLVIADQHAAVNTFRALYTPPVTPWELGAPEASEVTERSQLSKVRPMTGVKS